MVRRNQAFAFAALRDIPHGVAFIDTTSCILWANRTFAALSARNDGELVGLPFRDALPAAEPALEALVQRVLEDGTLQSDLPFALPPQTRDAPVQHWRATVAPVHADTGELLGATCQCTSDTHRVALSEQLVQSRKLEAAGHLANLVAHDFNNLLTVIIGYCELLLVDASDVSRRTMRLNEIHSAAEAAAHLSRQLLTLSRRNDGVASPVDLNLIVRTMSVMLRRILPANISHDIVLAEDLGLTHADPGEMQQVLMHLISNAVDAMPAGGVLTIETSNITQAVRSPSRPLLSPGDYVSLTVSDTGVGMGHATADGSVEPFGAEESAGSRPGLALSTVRTIVAQLGGDVSFSSAPGQGSTVSICLPRDRTVISSATSAPGRNRTPSPVA